MEQEGGGGEYSRQDKTDKLVHVENSGQVYKAISRHSQDMGICSKKKKIETIIKLR